MLKALRYVCALLFFMCTPLVARDVLLEFKGAFFHPTDRCIKEIFHRGGALYGPEITFQFCEDRNWYGFASVDFLSKKGHSIGLCDDTKMHLVPLAFGVKYFLPFCYGDFYVGLGFQPVHVKTFNCSQFVSPVTSQWALGGIAKIGTYFDIPCNFFIDVFVDYSTAHVKCETCTGTIVEPVRTKMNGAIFGAGFGYRFN